MEYTIKELADLAGVSTRTLRYYDEIALLSPCRLNQSGYRIYSSNEVDRLQQILFYRELDFDLKTIQSLLEDPAYNRLASLKKQLTAMTTKQKHTERLIETLKKTILQEEGKTIMKDQEKFIGLKEKQIAQNEKKYGREAREKYGNDTIDAANEKLRAMTQDTYESTEALGKKINALLEEAVKNNDSPADESGRLAATLHQQWIKAYWSQYSIEAHHGLVDMYLADERFKAYYDNTIEGCAEFLRDAVKHWIN
ncbi:MerR family transcriptional regulator [Eubacteriaceae bacterium ES3]|nr:MerR family transcriptional regulator [Eubacteriaceae bacterium ES3]